MTTEEILKVKDIEKLKSMIDKKSLVASCPQLDFYDIDLRILKTLINNGVDINLQNTDKNTILHAIVYREDIEALEFLINNGADISIVNKYGDTALIIASRNINIDIIKLLIMNNVDVNFQNKYTGITALMQVAMPDSCISDVNFQNKHTRITDLIQGAIPVLYISNDEHQKKADIVKLLIKNGADVNILDKQGKNAYWFAQYDNTEKISDILIENGTNTNVKLNKTNDLMVACKNGDLKKVQFLINTGIDVNLQNEKENTALIFAVKYQHKDIVELLLENNAYVNIKVDGREHLLFYGIKQVLETKIIELLINNGADVNIKDDISDTALMYAVRNNNTEVSKLLIKNGANIDAVDTSGNTFSATIYSGNGKTALVYATKNANIDIVKALLKSGASLYYEIEHFNDNGACIEIEQASVLDIAIKNRDFALVDLLFNYKNIETDHNPKTLVKLLTNFTIDKPIKYTTHIWDFGDFKKTYGDFQGFMKAVADQWEEMNQDLQILSPDLHDKIYNFLLNKNNTDTWCSKTNIAVGWSSIDGLEEWCNDGHNPFDFEINKKNITTFGEAIAVFKREIEIRNENNMLENIFLKQKKNLGKKFMVDLIKLKGRSFYTDVEFFENFLDIIFHEIKKRDDFKQVTVEVFEAKAEYIEIKIIHFGSEAGRSAQEMLTEAESGDWNTLKEKVKNLCDWSIESSHEDESYRINYLKEGTVNEIEPLSYKPEGFTHILRFYNK